jgi:hypothetical protein
VIVAANPSTLVNLARAGDREKESLIRDVRDGTLNRDLDIPVEVRSILERRLRRHPDRAKELEDIVRRTGTLYPVDYWPHECLLGNWTGGSVRAYMRHYPRYFGAHPVRDVGLIASEGRMTIPLEDGTPSGVLDITSHYFEFLPEEEAEKSQPVVIPAHEVEVGRNYFILLTTAYGLYRYDIQDLVRVTGFHNGTPLLEFLSKGSHFANITGEKLSEYHVTQAIERVQHRLDLTFSTYSVAPCWNDEQPYYGLFVEHPDAPPERRGELAGLLEQQLAELNIEYAGKRASGRLGPVRLQLLSEGSWQTWDRQRLARTGGTMEQYKHPCLIPDLSFRDSMPVLEEAPAGFSASTSDHSTAPYGASRAVG